MKKIIFALSTLALLSCSKESVAPLNDDTAVVNEETITTRRALPTTDVPPTLVPFNTVLVAGQNYDIGTVDVYLNVDGDLEVKYTLFEDVDWIITETHLFVGTCGAQPMNGQGNPQVGRFPMKTIHEPGVTTMTYDTSDFPDEGCIAAHAVVVSPDGTVSHTAWGEGLPYSTTSGGQGNNWAMIFGFELSQ